MELEVVAAEAVDEAMAVVVMSRVTVAVMVDAILEDIRMRLES